MNETYVTIAGNATTDPVARRTRTGERMVTFRLASNVRRRRPETGLYEDVETTYVGVVAYRQLAENIAESLTKGQPLLVHGRLRVQDWENGEKSGTNVEIEAHHVGHDLARGRSVFQKRNRVWTEDGEETERPADAWQTPPSVASDGPAPFALAADGPDVLPGDDARDDPDDTGDAPFADAATDAYVTVGAGRG